MKIKITYQQDDELAGVLSCLMRRYGEIKLRQSDRHPPYRHAYITINASNCERTESELRGRTAIEARANPEKTEKT